MIQRWGAIVRRTVPELVAAAHGLECSGPLACFFCGAPCDGSRRAEDFVRDSFNGRGEVAAPGSPGVCEGCVLCLREHAAIDLIDGTRGRRVTKAAMRAFSWLVAGGRMAAASKAHLHLLRPVLLAPPDPPWALVLSDSGKRHLLYRGAVNHADRGWVVTLEGDRITGDPASLADRLRLVGRLVAAWGKPALAEAMAPSRAFALFARYGGEEAGRLLAEWSRVGGEPLSRLALWLSANKEDCEREHPGIGPAADPGDPGRRGGPPQAGRAGRPGAAGGGRGRVVRDPRRGGPLLFDLGEPVRG